MSKLKGAFENVGRKLAVVGPALFVVGSSVVALAEPTLTVPDIDTATLYSCAGKAFAAIAIIVAIIIGIRLFKSAGGK